MKTTELMRFDLVDYNGSVAKIDCIYNDKVVIAIAPFDEPELVDYAEATGDEIKPIRLTEEMLKQNGWEMAEDNGFILFRHPGVIPAIVLHRDSGDYSFCTFRLRDVHIFQHLLWLLGHEDLADNFQIEEFIKRMEE